MEFAKFIENSGLMITEGSIYEKLRRFPNVALDPHIANANLIYDPMSAEVLRTILREYLAVGQEYKLPMFTLTNTWRANAERVQQSDYSAKNVNADCVNYYRGVIEGIKGDSPIYLGGLTGCRGDAYRAEEALNEADAYSFHLPQVTELADAGVDFLFAATLPAKSEAVGIARAMAETGVPYIISFVIRADGTLLDGTLLRDAVEEIDAKVPQKPLRFMVNCSHSSTFRSAQPFFQSVAERIAGLQANTSARDPLELDGSEELETEGPESFGKAMRSLREDFKLQIVGGCCGTDTAHIEALARELSQLES